MHELLNKIAAINIFAIWRALITAVRVAEVANYVNSNEGEEF